MLNQSRSPLAGPFALQMSLQGPPDLQGVLGQGMGQIAQVNAQNLQAERERRAHEHRLQLMQALMGKW